MDCHAVQAGKNTVPVIQQERQFRASQDDGFNSVPDLHSVNDFVDFLQGAFFYDALLQLFINPPGNQLTVRRIRNHDVNAVFM